MLINSKEFSYGGRERKETHYWPFSRSLQHFIYLLNNSSKKVSLIVPLSKWPGSVACLKTTSSTLSIAGLSHQTNHRRECHTHRNEHISLHCAHRLSVKNELNSSGIFKSYDNVIMWFHFSFFAMLNFLNGRCQEPLMAPDITVKLVI